MFENLNVILGCNGRWQELYNWSHPLATAPSHARADRLEMDSEPFFLFLLLFHHWEPLNITAQGRAFYSYNVAWLRIIWNWDGNVSIIILASGSPETFSYLRALLSAGYWTISSLKESGIKYCKNCKCSVSQIKVLNFNIFKLQVNGYPSLCRDHLIGINLLDWGEGLWFRSVQVISRGSCVNTSVLVVTEWSPIELFWTAKIEIMFHCRKANSITNATFCWAKYAE